MWHSNRKSISALLTLIATAILVTAGVVFAVNFVAAHAERDAMRGTVRAIAEVTRVEVLESGSHDDQETLVTPTVKFSTESGVAITTQLAPGRGMLSYMVGDLVGVRYDRAEPTVAHAEPDTLGRYIQMFLSGLATLAALALYVVAIIARLAR